MYESLQKNVYNVRIRNVYRSLQKTSTDHKRCLQISTKKITIDTHKKSVWISENRLLTRAHLRRVEQRILQRKKKERIIGTKKKQTL